MRAPVVLSRRGSGMQTDWKGPGMDHVATVPDLLWTPGADRVARSAMARFLERVGEGEAVPVDGYKDLWHWSVGAR